MSDPWQTAREQAAVQEAATTLYFARKSLIVFLLLTFILIPAGPAYLWGLRWGCLTFLLFVFGAYVVRPEVLVGGAVPLALCIAVLGSWTILRARATVPR